MTEPFPAAPPRPIEVLLDDLLALRARIVADRETMLAAWRADLARPAFAAGAANLAAYLAMRRHDLAPLQDELSYWGLSSLGRCESRVVASLDAVASTLADLAGRALPPGVERPDSAAWLAGRAALQDAKRALFGTDPEGPRTRIMVTLPVAAATDAALMPALIAAGADCVRINCAHDDPATWAAMIANVRRAAAAAGRRCPVLMDIAGPKLRVDRVFGDEAPRVHLHDRFALTAGEAPPAALGLPAIACRAAGVVASLADGAALWYDDGKFGAVVESRAEWGVVMRITAARDKGARLRPEKGLAFPDLDADLPALTDKDLDDLDFVARHADIVGFSFVQTPEDVRRLRHELARRRTADAALPPVVLKIETRRAVENLPHLIAAAAGRQPLAVMIARGDLALDLGFKRLSEVQEEILWLCEAAHVPTIWATQVLERLIKDGLPTRAETTDAAMGQRAECVMLNKGPHVVEGVRFLDDVLRRMDRHQHKKSARLAPLRAWRPHPADSSPT